MNNSFGPVQVLGMVVVGAAMLLCYGIMPFIGFGVLTFFDYAAYAFRWIGISVPFGGWALLGGAIGGAIGLSRSLRRVGKPGMSPKVAVWGMACFACLYVLSFTYCHVMKPVRAAAPPAVTAPAVTAPANTAQ
jgi:hypothetical protein